MSSQIIDSSGILTVRNEANNADASLKASVLELTSTTAGFKPPRMTTTQRTGISTPGTGAIVFDTDTGKLYQYTGSVWAAVAAGTISGTLPTYATPSDLTAVSGPSQGDKGYVTDLGIYEYVAGATDPADGEFVIDSTSGRWFQRIPHGDAIFAYINSALPSDVNPTQICGYSLDYLKRPIVDGSIIMFSADNAQWSAIDDPVLVRLDTSSDETESNQNTVTPVAKWTRSLNLVDGNYIVSWYAEVKSTSSYNVSVAVVVDSTEVGSKVMDTKAQYVDFSGWYFTTLQAGLHNFYLNYASGTAGQSAYIRRARLNVVKA